MTTMLEKVAAALYGEWLKRPDTEAEARRGGPFPPWPACDTTYWLASARAALLAIRDLDSGDVNSGGVSALVAGKQALYSCTADPELGDARGCFHAMIDAILRDA